MKKKRYNDHLSDEENSKSPKKNFKRKASHRIKNDIYKEIEDIEDIDSSFDDDFYDDELFDDDDDFLDDNY